MKVYCPDIRDAKNYQVGINLAVPYIDKTGYFDTDEDTFKRLKAAQPEIFVGQGEEGFVEPVVFLTVDEELANAKNSLETIRGERDDLKSRFEQTSSALTQKQADLDKANSDLSEAKQKATDLQAALDKANAEITKLKKKEDK